MTKGRPREFWPRIVVVVLAIAWATVLIFSFAPGAMSEDSVAILQQARSGVIGDGHPPLMALLWGLADSIVPGQTLMMGVMVALYCAGATLIFWSLVARIGWLSPIGFSLFAIQPATLGILGALWIDVLMASLFLCAIGFAALASVTSKKTRIACLVAATVFLFAAAGSRHNAAAAALPLWAFLLVVVLRVPQARPSSAVFVSGAALVLTLLSIACWHQINSRVINTPPTHLWTFLAMYDIAGTAVKSGDPIPQLAAISPVQFADVAVLYSPRSIIPLQVGVQLHTTVDPKPTATGLQRHHSVEWRETLRSQWISAIFSYPIAYLTHRWSVFSSLIGLPPYTELWAPVYSRVLQNEHGIEPWLGSARSLLVGALGVLSRRTIIFTPAVYLVVGLLFLPFSLILALRWNDPVMWMSSALFASGLCHMAGLFFSALSSDFRYSHWLVVTTSLGGIILLSRLAFRWALRRDAVPTQAEGSRAALG